MINADASSILIILKISSKKKLRMLQNKSLGSVALVKFSHNIIYANVVIYSITMIGKQY